MNKNYIILNNKVNQKDKNGNYINLELDKQAVREYFLNNVNQNTVFFHSLEEKLDYLVENGYYDKKVLDKYTMEEIKEIFKIAYGKKIRFRSYTGAVTFYERYAMRTVDNERILERYEDRLSMIALTIGRNYDEAKEFINILADRQLQGATPIFMNSGKLRSGGMTSCFLLDIEDNLESINYAMNSAMQMSKIGGGVGLNLTKLRARGEAIKDVENRASGVLPPSKVFEDIFSYINQLGQRSGSGVVHLSIFHNDIEEFINSKKVNADEKLRLKTLSTAIIIPDKFMELLKDNSSRYYYTFYPKNVYNVTGMELDSMDMNEWYDKLVKNKDIRKTQRDKLKLVQEIIRSQKESGFSYIIFIDTMNREHNLKQIGRINMSNLCVSYDTKILTKEYGYVKIGSIENQLVNVWNGEQWSETVVKKTGENQELFKVKTSNLDKINVTKYHKFYILNKNGRGYKEVRTKDLTIGDKLIKFDLPFNQGYYGKKKLKNAYANGFFSADGNEEFKLKNSKEPYRRLILCNEKRNLLYKFLEVKYNSISENKKYQRITINGLKELKPKYFVPFGYNIKSIMSWLSGFADGDGSIRCVNGLKDLTFNNINFSFLKDIQLLLQEIGIYSKMRVQNQEYYRDFPKKFREKGTDRYYCKKAYTLHINSINFKKLVDYGFKTFRMNSTISYVPTLDTSQHIKIVSIEKLKGLHDTYCFTEPLRNMGMFNGMLLGNCTEIAQLNSPNKFSDNIYEGTNEYGYDIQCVLSNLNLVNLFECKTDEERKNVIISSMKFLSNVSDLSNIDSVPSVNKSRDDFHSVGLGTMGLNTLFVKLGIEYESEEAKDLTNLLFMYIRYYSLYSSMLIAKERGKFKYFEKSEYANGKALEKYINGYIKLQPVTDKVKEILKNVDINLPTKEDWINLDLDIRKYGLYNAYQLTQAPNQSSAYLMETSPSVLPVSSEVEIRDYGYLQTVYPMPLLTNENKHLYKSAYDIDQKKMLDLIRVIQEHIDQSISTTINIKSSTSMKEHLGIIIYAWKKGIKSLYYWRTQKQSIMADKEPVCESCSV